MNSLVISDKETAVAPATTQAMVAGTQQEIQGAMILARQFPRNQGMALKNIEAACANLRLAETAEYSYPKGGQTVEGPSIRLLEAVKQSWGNVRAGIKITNQTAQESHASAYAWDLETNDYHEISFIVSHWRDTKKGGYAITDSREIYELVANYGSRRVRKCLETVIPRHIVDAARDAANATLANAGDIEKRRAEMVKAFATLGVTIEQIEKRLGKKAIGISSPEIIALRKVYQSVRDGMTTVADWFESHDPQQIVREQAEAAKPDPAKMQATAKAMFDKACSDALAMGADPLALLRQAIPNPKLTKADVDKATGAVLTAYAELIDQWVKANQP